MELGLLVLRVVVGLLFVGHGAQKLFGVFGGHGVHGTAGFMDSLGMKPGKPHALAAGTAEFAGGALLALGLLSPLAAVMLIAVMTVAILTVHAKNGLWNSDGGMEFNLTLIAAAFAIAAVGAGSWSLDSALNLDVAGTGWGLAALGTGILGGLGAYAFGRFASRDRPTQAHPTAA
jgi:putative oxidoreductase